MKKKRRQLADDDDIEMTKNNKQQSTSPVDKITKIPLLDWSNGPLTMWFCVLLVPP